MTLRRFILFTVAMALALAASAQDATFELLKPRNVVEGRNFNITYRLVNAEGNAPEAPELAGCTLLYGPAVSTMASTQIVNGRLSSSSSVDYTFTYRADQAGHVEIPAAAIRTDNGTLRSQGASFEILPADRDGSSNSIDRPAQQSVQNVDADDLLVRVFFSKNTVYEQEPVVATIKVYTKFDISAFIPTVQPAFEGFLTEELEVSPEVSIENYNGQNYHCAVLKRLLLYPQRSGRLSVNSGSYDVTIVQHEILNMGFFRTSRPVERQITTTSNAASLNVRPLPQPAPEGFAGAVGQFSAATSLDPEVMRTNEASVYSYTITGTGNIKFLSPTQMSFPASVESYTPRTEVDTRLIAGGANMSGTYRTDFTIVPTEVGNFVIEGKPLVFFNPSDGKYHTVEVPDMPIRVLRGTGAAAAPAPTEIDAHIDDILHIRPSDIVAQNAEINYAYSSPLYWLAYVLLLIILLGTIFLYRRNIRLRSDVAGRRLAKAGRVAQRRLKQARSAMDAKDSDSFYASLASAMWGYISDKLGIAPSQLTRENVAGKLESYGVSSEGTKDILDVLDSCEMARFTPMGSSEEMADIYARAAAAVAAVENGKK